MNAYKEKNKRIEYLNSQILCVSINIEVEQ